MSIETLIEGSGQLATITAEAPRGQGTSRTSMGGADRSDANWLTVADGVPCLVAPEGAALDRDRNDARQDRVTATVYFARDPAPEGLSTRHRIAVTSVRPGRDPVVVGVYAVTGVVDRLYLGRLFEASAERVRTP
jgi:hypothetical protein